jgi:hypothetical protein
MPLGFIRLTPLTRHRFILMDAFDTARLGFIQHLWHDVACTAWFYSTPAHRKEKEEKKRSTK